MIFTCGSSVILLTFRCGVGERDRDGEDLREEGRDSGDGDLDLEGCLEDDLLLDSSRHTCSKCPLRLHSSHRCFLYLHLRRKCPSAPQAWQVRSRLLVLARRRWRFPPVFDRPTLDETFEVEAIEAEFDDLPRLMFLEDSYFSTMSSSFATIGSSTAKNRSTSSSFRHPDMYLNTITSSSVNLERFASRAKAFNLAT